MSSSNVSELIPRRSFLQSYSETRSIQPICAKIHSALSLANCAGVCAAETICTACRLAKVTFAGTLASSFHLQ